MAWLCPKWKHAPTITSIAHKLRHCVSVCPFPICKDFIFLFLFFFKFPKRLNYSFKPWAVCQHIGLSHLYVALLLTLLVKLFFSQPTITFSFPCHPCLWHTEGLWKKGQVLRIFTTRVSGKIVTLRLWRFKNRGQWVSPAILGCVLRITVLSGGEREREREREREKERDRQKERERESCVNDNLATLLHGTLPC